MDLATPRSTSECSDFRSGESDGVVVDLALLRQRFAALEQVDAELTEALARVTEARALASLEIGSAIAKIERKVAERERTQSRLMTNVAHEVDAARARTDALADVTSGLEDLVTRVQATIVPRGNGEHGERAAQYQGLSASAELGPSHGTANGTQKMVIAGVPSVDVARAIQRFAGRLPGVECASASAFKAGLLKIELQTSSEFSSVEIAGASSGGLIVTKQAGTDHCFALADASVFSSR